jgi:hypothetical protein
MRRGPLRFERSLACNDYSIGFLFAQGAKAIGEELSNLAMIGCNALAGIDLSFASMLLAGIGRKGKLAAKNCAGNAIPDQYGPFA